MEEESDLDQSERIVKSLYNMVTHDEQCSMEDRVKTAIRSAVLVNCMKTSGYLCLEKQPNQQDFFMQLLYHMQMAMAHRSGNEYNGFLFHHLQNVSNMEKLKANFFWSEKEILKTSFRNVRNWYSNDMTVNTEIPFI